MSLATAAFSIQTEATKKAQTQFANVLNAQEGLVVLDGTTNQYFYATRASDAFTTTSDMYEQTNQLVRRRADGHYEYGDSFTTSFRSLMGLLKYQLSEKAQTTYDKVQQTTMNEMTKVQTAYASAMGVQKTFDEITKIIRTTWYEDGKTLSWVQMRNSKVPLSELLVNMPASGQSVLNALQLYIEAARDALPFMDATNVFDSNMRAIKNALDNPAPENGSMKVSANGVDVQNLPAFNFAPESSKILNDLTSLNNSISISIELTKESNSKTSVSIDGQAGFTIPGSWWVFGGSASGSAEYDFSQEFAMKSTVKIDVEWKNPTIVTRNPKNFDASAATGWFFDSDLKSALNKSSAADYSGPVFNSKPALNLHKDGDFGYVKTAVLSQQPAFTITYSCKNSSSFEKSFHQHSEASCKLFGIFTIGKVSSDSSSYDSSFSSTEEGFTIRYAPPPINGTPLEKQQAFLLGAAISWPCAE